MCLMNFMHVNNCAAFYIMIKKALKIFMKNFKM